MPLIRVVPAGGAWIVTLDGDMQGKPHASGRAAETAARALAADLAAQGQPCELQIELRDRSLAARLKCWWGALGPVFRAEPTSPPLAANA